MGTGSTRWLLHGLLVSFWISSLLVLCLRVQAYDLTTSDRVAMLYSSQLRFSVEGDPLIDVGLVEGKEEIRFRPDQPITVLPMGEGGPVIELPADLEYRVSLLEGNGGTYRYWAVVARQLESDRQALASLREEWQALNLATQTFGLGSFFAIQGVTFDNRQTILAVGGMEDRQAALDLAETLERDYGLPPELHAELVEFPSGELELVAPELGIRIRHRDLLWIETPQGGRYQVPGDTFSIGDSSRREEDRAFAGTLIFAVDRQGKLVLINQLPAERLLEGTLPAEIYPSAPMEALKAQAVAARSVLLAELGVRHLADPYMLCARQHCQVYRGVAVESARTSRAVRETRGQVLLHGDYIAHAVYSASCGGYGGNYADTWGHQPVGYLAGRFDGEVVPEAFRLGLNEENLSDFLTAPVDSYCNIQEFGGSNTFRWRVQHTAEELGQIVNQRHEVGTLRRLEILRRDSSGRVILLRIVGDRNTVEVERELPIRRALGGLRSALFIMDQQTGADDGLTGVTFVGGGFGHGVGLCQTGAIGAAQRGIDYLSILAHYYPQTRVQTLWP
ncbi:MAG: SpoIID/LytB domain-containing protein [Bradymonadales bacterium]|nr:SpoIID/LytB domain-containing protein [Bradymonadales bacterium]